MGQLWCFSFQLSNPHYCLYYIVVGADYTHPIGFVSPKKYHNYAPAINSLNIMDESKKQIYYKNLKYFLYLILCCENLKLKQSPKSRIPKIRPDQCGRGNSLLCVLPVQSRLHNRLNNFWCSIHISHFHVNTTEATEIKLVSQELLHFGGDCMFIPADWGSQQQICDFSLQD